MESTALTGLFGLAERLRSARERSSAIEEKLRDALNSLCGERGAASRVASVLGISQPYIHDLRKGKRGISDEMVVRIIERKD